MTIPTPTPFTPDGNYTVSPWTDYYLQVVNETLVEQHNEMLGVNVAILVVLVFIIGMMLTIKFRRAMK